MIPDILVFLGLNAYQVEMGDSGVPGETDWALCGGRNPDTHYRDAN